MKIRLLLVDDHQLVRSALSKMLASVPDVQAVKQATSAEEATELLRQESFEVLVLDLDLPGLSGRELALKVLEQNPQQGVLILSYRVDPAEVQFLVEAGVRGYVPKSAPAEELVRAILSVAAGRCHLSPEAASALASSLRQSGGDKLNPLSVRQTVILQNMARGLTTKEIADQLCLSPKTVEKYRSEILRRLNSKNQVQALEAARRLNLLGE